MADKSFKVKDGLVVPSLSTAGIVKTDSSGSISSASVLGISEGGTGQTSAGNALNALLPLQTSNENKYLQTNGVTVQWNAIGSTYSIGNTASRPLSPVIGQIYSNSETGYIEVYTAQGWSQLGVIPKTPTLGTATDIGTGRAFNNAAATLTFTPDTSGGLASVYTATSSPGAYVGTSPTGSPITITGLQSNTSYTFNVVATNGYGNSLATTQSNSITATSVPQAPTAGTPTSPTGQAFGSTASISVPVTANGTGGKSITSYTATSSPGGITGSSASSPITVSGLTRETAYTFTITATNANGTSLSSSASSSATPTTVPQTMSAPTATNSGSGRSFNNGLASVSFSAPASNGGQSVTGYTITSSPGGYTGTGASSPINVAGLQSNTNYTFTATATNSNGTSTASAASNQILATTVPQAPTIGTVSVTNDTTVSIPFTAGANGGTGITSYTTTSSPSIALTTTGTTSPLTVTGSFAAGTGYTFTIAAVNANGTSSSSASSNSVAPNVGTIGSWTLNQTVPYPSGVTSNWRYQQMGYTKSGSDYQYYIAGGISAGQRTYNTTANSATSGWTERGATPISTETTGGTNVSAAPYNGRFHIFQGTNHFSIGYGQTSWTSQTAIPASTTYGNGGATSNGIYLLLGNNTNSFYRWVPNAWTTLATYPTTIVGALTSAGGGIFLSAGGNTTNSIVGTKTQAAYAYNESNNTWSAIANYPILNGWSITGNNYVTQTTSSGLTINRHYIGNGTGSGNGGVADIHSYNQATNVWRTESSSPQGNRGVNTFYNDVARVMVHFGGDAWNNDVPRYLWTAPLT